MNAPAITTKSLLHYGFIALPVAFAGFPLYVLAPDFYATQYGLSLTLLGVLLLAIRLFDAVQDPLIGWLADRLQGRFLPLITAAGIVLSLAIFGLFNGMPVSPTLWFAVCMMTAVSAYSVLTITLGTHATLWTTDKTDQTRIAAAREGFGLIGLVVAVSMPTLLTRLVEPGHVYLWYAATLAALTGVGILCFSRTLPRATQPGTARRIEQTSVFLALRTLPPESTKLFAVYALGMLASSVPAVLVIFFVRDLLGAEHLTGLFLLLYFLSGALGMPVWKRISARLGKYKAWALSNILAVAGFIWAFFLGAGDVWSYAAVCIASGLALGADLTLPPSLLADHIHARDNTKYAGTHYSFLAFIAKACLALASAIALPVLDAAGFMPKAANSADALFALSAAYALIPCVLKLFAAGSLYLFFLKRRQQ